MKMYAILVVYNRKLEDSSSYRFIRTHNEIRTVVVDNSTSDVYGNRETAESDGCVYLTNGINLGLSQAYNFALDCIQKENPEMDGKVILLDDDTDLNEEYIQEAEAVSCEIAIPIVKDGNAIISPNIVKNGIVRAWNGTDELKDYSAINSGMVISLKLFKAYRYDENLFLDYVDHQFIKDMKNKDIQIMKSVLQQHFSGSDTSDMQASKRRFKLFKKDSKMFYRDQFLTGTIVIWKRKISLAVKYKNLSFLFM